MGSWINNLIPTLIGVVIVGSICLRIYKLHIFVKTLLECLKFSSSVGGANPKITGKYKFKDVEGFVAPGRARQGVYEVRMKIAGSTNKSDYARNNLNPHFFIKDDWMVFFWENPWVAPTKEQMCAILEELYQATDNFKNDPQKALAPVECLSCAEPIPAGQDKCPKCGWTWGK